jgi:hypothetical protein
VKFCITWNLVVCEVQFRWSWRVLKYRTRKQWRWLTSLGKEK